jgi:hypothetical protein
MREITILPICLDGRTILKWALKETYREDLALDWAQLWTLVNLRIPQKA